jgi:nucleotide-binding universal stress UspA family protein
MKILLGIDDSKSSGDVVAAIVKQFQPDKTEIRVMHVLQPLVPTAPPQMAAAYAPELEYQKKEALELVERIAGDLRSAGFITHTAIGLGDVREKIIDSAADLHADLIVVGSHGRTGIERFLLGSVAESVARNAKCSVLIVRGKVGA